MKKNLYKNTQTFKVQDTNQMILQNYFWSKSTNSVQK